MKATAIAVAVPTLIGGGLYWAQKATLGTALSYLLPLVAFALFGGLFGYGTFHQNSAHVLLYEGLIGNPNAFGILLALSLPYPLFAAFRTHQRGTDRATAAIWLAIAAVLLILLWFTGSRGAALCALFVIAAALAALLRRNILIPVALAGLVLAGTVASLPMLREGLVQHLTQFVTKGHPQGLLYSRRNTWSKSLDGALKGGIIGVGVGVSTGDTNFKGALSSRGYGREKGNSQLAIAEETGLIGVAIYVALIAQLFFVLVSGAIAATDRETRLQLALMTGALMGLVAHSVFEAWWLSPASSEAVYFWATVGVASGLVRNSRIAAAGAPESSEGTTKSVRAGR
jgi:hypothetical protein